MPDDLPDVERHRQELYLKLSQVGIPATGRSMRYAASAARRTAPAPSQVIPGTGRSTT